MGRRYTDVDNSYLSAAISRISGGIESISAIPVVLDPPVYWAEKMTDSYWAISALLTSNEDIASDVSLQTWSVYAYLIYKPNQTQYTPEMYSGMYALVPQTFNFMQAHKRLVFEDGQAPLKYLQDDLVQVTLNSLNQNGQPGFSIAIRLPFRLMFQQE